MKFRQSAGGARTTQFSLVLVAVVGCHTSEGGPPRNPASRANTVTHGATGPMTYAPPEAAEWFRAQVDRLEHARATEMPQRLVAALRALAANTGVLAGRSEAEAIGAAADRLQQAPDASGEAALLASALDRAGRVLLATTEAGGPQRAQQKHSAQSRLEAALRGLDGTSSLVRQQASIVDALEACVDLVHLAYGAAPPYAA